MEYRLNQRLKCYGSFFRPKGLFRWILTAGVLPFIAFFVARLPASESTPSFSTWSVYQEAKPHFFSGEYDFDAEEFLSLTFANNLVGWDFLVGAGFYGRSTIVGNIEAGHIWSGHEVFGRPSGWNPVLDQRITGNGALDEDDFHATAVGHVLAGTGFVGGNFTDAGLGMALNARLWSGAIATSYDSNPNNLGGFSTTTESMLSVYRSFFQGIDGERPDVINSSWGGTDAAAGSVEAITVDALAAAHPDVALVVAAGNGGEAPVSSPGSNYNVITVGSTGGPSFDLPSEFSSSGLVDFYNPDTEQLLTGVRVGVDLAAPGEFFFLAAYLGETGGRGAAQLNGLSTPSPSDLYFLNMSGTSFASPMVAGGIALLKDAAKTDLFFNLNAVPHAFDTRVIKAVLLASARPTAGWNNGQATGTNGVIRTTQALDPRTGAGLLQLEQATGVYLLSETRGLPAGNSTLISASGWLFADVGVGSSTDFSIQQSLAAGTQLAVALTWFAGRHYEPGPLLDTGFGEDLSFADLNLSVWKMEGGLFHTLVAESASLYQNTEFLRFHLPAAGFYGLRVTFHGLIYDITLDGINSAEYALAWNTLAIPEPTTLTLLVLLFAVLLLRRLPPSRLR